MDIIPTEIIAHIFQYLDAKSLVQMSYVSRIFHISAEANLKWVKLCFTDPVCQSLISAAELGEDLLSNKIDAKSFYESFNAQDMMTMQSLIFSTNIKEFTLFVASYEKKTPVFFAYPANEFRKLYLTEEAAKKNTPNAASVKNWLRVKIPVTADQFAALYTTKTLQYKESIPPSAIVTSPPLESRTVLLSV